MNRKLFLRILLISSVFIGILGMVLIIVAALNAEMPGRIALGVVSLIMIILGCLGLVAYIVLFIVFYRKEIKEMMNQKEKKDDEK